MGFTVGIAALVILSTLIPASLQMTSGCTDCHTYASCYNNTCVCNEGYTGDGMYCEALCSEECGVNAFCTREYDDMYYTYTYECQCSEGYTGDPTSYCGDINECLEYCLENYAYCTNTVGRYICDCPYGYFYSYVATECLEIDSDEPYRAPALVVKGCNERRNARYRSRLIQDVQEFIQEYLDAISQFSSGSGSGDRGSGSGDRGSGSGDRGSGSGDRGSGPSYGPPYGK